MSIVKEVKKKGYTALFIDVTELITAYRDTYTKHQTLQRNNSINLLKT